MPDTTDLQFYIEHGKEERYLEYKSSMTLTGQDVTKVKIAKAMMAMSNLRNGGVIVVGMKEISRGVWQPDAITQAQITSFNQDDIAQCVNDHAVPSVRFEVQSLEFNSNRFVIIQVSEFDITPTICRKPKAAGGEDLRLGAIYYRSKRKNESAPISSEEDMRELIELTVDKNLTREMSRLRSLGLVAAEPKPEKLSALNYEQEREGL